MCDDVIKVIRSILNPNPAGMLIQEINKEYKELTGEPVPFARFKFNSLQDFLRASNQFNGTKTPRGFKLTAKVTETSKHVNELARTQNISKQERKRRSKMLTGNPAPLKRSTSKTRIMANIPPTPKKYGGAAKQVNRRRNNVTQTAPIIIMPNIAPPKSIFKPPTVAETTPTNILPPLIPLTTAARLKMFAATSSRLNADLSAKASQNSDSKSLNGPACAEARKPTISPSYTPLATPIKVFPTKSSSSTRTPSAQKSRVNLHERFVPKQLPPVEDREDRKDREDREDREMEEKIEVKEKTPTPPILSGRALLFKKIAELSALKAIENDQMAKRPNRHVSFQSPYADFDSQPKLIEASNLDEISQKMNDMDINVQSQAEMEPLEMNESENELKYTRSVWTSGDDRMSITIKF